MSSSLLIAMALFSWAMDPAPGPSVPFWWTAYPEADNTLLVNPAGSSWLIGSRLRVGAIFSDSTFEHFDRFTLEDKSGGLAGWWEDNQSLRRFTTSGSYMFGSSLSAGLGFTWYDPTIKNHPQEGEKFFTFGLNLRPDDHIGLGATARTSTGDIDGCYIAGIALRPLGDETITLTGDYRFESGIIDSRWATGVEVRAIDGLTFRGSCGENDMFSAGIQFDFGKAGITAGSDISDGNYLGATTELILNEYPQPGIIQPLPDFLSYSAANGDELPSKSFLGPRVPSFTTEMAALARGTHDSDVKGLLVDFSDYSLSAAQAEELREIMIDYRATGKPVFAYMEYAGNGSYYTATAARAICMHKAGQISISGFSGYTFFVRGFLDKIGIYPDLMHIGAFKSASDMLTEYDISEAQIEATTALLETYKTELIRGISEGRGLEPAQMSILFSQSPFAGESMVRMGLADTLLYRDQFEEFVENELGHSVKTMSPVFYSNLPAVSSNWGFDPRVAVVVADGNITGGHSGSSLLGRTMGSETVIEMLERAANTEGVRAIVLRINSGGGEAMASDDMHHAVENIREQMPVVVSMGSVAASGGYYMACGADAIFADKMTVTGSIGIISGKFVFGDLLDMVGINVEKVEIRPSGNAGNPFEPYTEEQYEHRFDAMREGYNLFVTTVAKGREMTFDEVDAIAQGRVWSGIDALEIGLIDYTGGVVDAIAHAAMLADMDNRNPEIVIFPRLSGLGTISLLPGLSVFEAAKEISEHPFINSEGPLYLAPTVVIE
ncbi:MAG: signal peptide peptidase SppA [Candidatus Sabulitectum sp.]|nr:signal peptide peptidase SppA [Candidatus Sabulitectum sp.]